MVLSPNVAKSSLKKDRAERGEVGPFSQMNRTEARIDGRRPPRSAAARKRSGTPEEAPKKESPLFKALKMQTMLSPIPYSRRTAIKNKISEITSFDQFPLLESVRQAVLTNALEGLTDVKPTPIQSVAIPSLLKDPLPKPNTDNAADMKPKYDQYLLAAETGSGKTLAYLIPLVDALKRQEEAEKAEEARREADKAKEREEARKKYGQIEPDEAPLTDAGRPRIVILVPTAELVDQVGAKVKALSHTLKYRSGMISSSLTPRRIKNVVFRADGIDILVSTPYLLTSIAQKEPYLLSRVSHLVLDEADSLLDRSFAPTTREVISKAAPSLQRLILCSATIPRSLDNLLRKEYPKIRRLTTPNLHAIPRRVQMGVVDIEQNLYRGNRDLATADVIWSIGKAGDNDPADSMGILQKFAEPRVKKILVFVNESEKAAEVAKFLQSKGIDAVSLPQSKPSELQEILTTFTERSRMPTTDEIMEAKNRYREAKAIPMEMPTPKKPNRELPNTKVLVTTDRTSRGVDTMAVKTIILYDVPHNTIDFIHRIGRLGRMGRRGRAIVLIGKRDRKDVVREVREAMFRGQALI